MRVGRLCLGLFALLALTSCRACEERRGADGACLPPEKNEARVAISALPSTLDWNRSHESSAVNYPVLQAVMRGLTQLGEDGAPVPDLARSWERRVEGEREVWTFHLEPGVVWSDGVTRLTAADFVFGWRRALLGNEPAELKDIVGASEVLALRGEVGPADAARMERALEAFAVRALDELTLEVTLVSPRSYFPARLASVYTFYPSPSAMLRGLEETAIRRYFDEPGEGRPLVLGPFRIDAYDRVGQLVRLLRNPHDHVLAPPGALQKVLLIQADLAPLLWKRCQLDFFFVDDVASLPAMEREGNVIRQPLLSTYWLGLNTERLPLKIRQAIAAAIDRPALFEGLLPAARSSKTFLPEVLPGAPAPESGFVKDLPGYSPARARELLRESGFAMRPLTLLVRSRSTFLPELGIAAAVKAQLEAVGLTVEIVSSADFTADLKDGRGRTRHDLFLRRTGADFAHPHTFFTVFGPSGNHYTHWHERGAAARFSSLLVRGAAMADVEAAGEVYGEAQALLQSEAVALVPLYHPDRYFKRRPWLEGVGVTPFNFLTLRSARRAVAGGADAGPQP